MKQEVKKAKRIAYNAHKDQKYGNNKPYSYHLDQVVQILEDNQGTDLELILGYLHDVLEDTEITTDWLLDVFADPDIVIGVCLLTDPEGKNRKERKKALYDKMRMLDPEKLEVHKSVIKVKLADRLANVRSCVENDNKRLLSMYREEHEEFRRAVYRGGLCREIQVELDNLLSD